MTKKLTKVTMENDKLGFYLNIDGRKFRFVGDKSDKDGHLLKSTFKEGDDEEMIKRLEKVAEYLDKQAKLDTRTIIFEAIKHMSPNSLKRIEREMTKKTPVRVKRGCVELIIGKNYIPLVQ